MFTLRFIREGRDTKTFSAVSYEVEVGVDGSACISMSRRLDGDNPHREYVGDGYEFSAVYVTNLEGKTIDSIRQRPVENLSPGGTA